MPNFNGDVVFIDTSGQVRAQSGDLTLRGDSTNTRSVIIGSGAALRPDRDIGIDLGRPDLRWHRMYAGAITASSGTLDFCTFGGNTFIFDGGTIDVRGGTLQATLSSQISTDATSDLIINGPASFFGSTFSLSVDPLPNTDNTWRLGDRAKRFTHIFANSGVFNTISPPTSGTYINAVGSLVPERTALYSLGTSPLRWGTVFATSGDITTLGATTVNAADINSTSSLNAFGTFGVLGLAVFNGGTFFGNTATASADALYHLGLQGFRWAQLYAVSGFIETISPRTSGTFTTLNGSFIPDRTALRSLGTSAIRWGNLFATSGNITTFVATSVSSSTVTATTVTGDTVQANNLLDITGDGATLIHRGSLNWDGSGADVITSNLIQWDWGTANLLNIGTLDASSATFNSAVTASTFAKRPTLNSVDFVTRKDAVTTVHAVVTANSGAIINNTNEVDIYNYTIPANTLAPSGRLRLELFGNLTNCSAGSVNFTPRVYLGGTLIYGDVNSFAQLPVAGGHEIVVDILSLGSTTGQHIRGITSIGSRFAGSVTGMGDYGFGNLTSQWTSRAASGTTNMASPQVLRVSMQLGTANWDASYSGYYGVLTHTPWPNN